MNKTKTRTIQKVSAWGEVKPHDLNSWLQKDKSRTSLRLDVPATVNSPNLMQPQVFIDTCLLVTS